MSKIKLKKYCLALDLKDDQKKIDTYKAYHQNVWPEINKSIKDSGIKEAEIYLTGNRLFMIRFLLIKKQNWMQKTLKFNSGKN